MSEPKANQSKDANEGKNFHNGQSQTYFKTPRMKQKIFKYVQRKIQGILQSVMQIFTSSLRYMYDFVHVIGYPRQKMLAKKRPVPTALVV